MAAPLVSAHRGRCGTDGLALAESYRRAIALGADYVELDVRRTLDGAYVVHHDPCLPSGVPIAALPEREVRAALGDQGLGLRELVDLAAGRGRLHVDLKAIGDEAEVLEVLRARLEPEEFVVTTLEDVSVRAVKSAAPEVRVGLSLGRDMEGQPPWRVQAVRLTELYPGFRVRACRPDFLVPHRRLARLRVLRFAAAHALDCWVWTVDDELELRTLLADPRVTTVITNRPDLALRLREDK